MLLLGCGHKAPPLPPERLTPVGIVHVRPIVSPEELVLAVEVSDRYVNKGRKTSGVFLYAKRCNLNCEKCVDIYRYSSKPGWFFIEDSVPEEGRCYKVGGRTEEDVSFTPYVFLLFPKPFPNSPELEVSHLDASSVAFKVEGCERILLYRRDPSNFYGYMPHIVARSSSVVDSTVVEGRTYCYEARCFVEDRGVWFVSYPSPEVCVRPEDLEPPPVPKNLSGFYHKGVVKLVWDSVEAPDLEGYYVYVKRGGRWVKLNEKPLKVTVYTYRVAKGVKNLTFAVSSVDKKGNESAKSKPVVINW